MPVKSSRKPVHVKQGTPDPRVLIANLAAALAAKGLDLPIQRVDCSGPTLLITYYGGGVQQTRLNPKLTPSAEALADDAILSRLAPLRLAAAILGRDEGNKATWQPPSEMRLADHPDCP